MEGKDEKDRRRLENILLSEPVRESRFQLVTRAGADVVIG